MHHKRAIISSGSEKRNAVQCLSLIIIRRAHELLQMMAQKNGRDDY